MTVTITFVVEILKMQSKIKPQPSCIQAIMFISLSTTYRIRAQQPKNLSINLKLTHRGHHGLMSSHQKVARWIRSLPHSCKRNLHPDTQRTADIEFLKVAQLGLKYRRLDSFIAPPWNRATIVTFTGLCFCDFRLQPIFPRMPKLTT